MPRKPESEPLVLEHVYNPDPESAREAYVRALVHLIEFIVENDEHVDAQDQLVVQ